MNCKACKWRDPKSPTGECELFYSLMGNHCPMFKQDPKKTENSETKKEKKS